MYGAIQQNLAGQLDEIRNAGLFKGERVLSSPQQAHVGVEGRTDVLNMCANNYLGLANHPEVVQAAHEALDSLGQRHGLGPLHLRHAGAAQGARAGDLRVPGHRGHDPLFLVLGRQRRPVRDDPGSRGRRDLRRAQPCLDHRRHPALQGAAAALQEQRHGRSGGQAQGGQRGPVPADRHRRRLLDGRHHRRPQVRLRPGRQVRRPGDGRRLACRRASWASRAGERTSIAT